MIDLDPLWYLVVVLAALGVIPLLLALGRAARSARHSATAMISRSSNRGHRRRTRGRNTLTLAGTRRAPDAPGRAGRHARHTP
ncbi:MAG: hypothetical protein ACRDUV_12395 [Pseudonocardiaceae bacterium]